MDREEQGRDRLRAPAFGTETMANKSVYTKQKVVHSKLKLSPVVRHERPLAVTFSHPGLTNATLGRDGEPSIPLLFSLCSDLRNTGLMCPCQNEAGQSQGRNDYAWDTATQYVGQLQVGESRNRAHSNTDTGETLLGWPDVKSPLTEFVAVTELQLTKELYTMEAAHSVAEVRVGLGAVRTSSLLTTMELTLPGSSVPFLRHLLKVVCVDPANRRSRPFPDDFRQKFQGHGSMEDRDFRVDRFPKPDITFCRTVEVSLSDTDAKYHTNYASYVRFAMDTLHMALLQRKTSGLGHPGASNGTPTQRPTGNDKPTQSDDANTGKLRKSSDLSALDQIMEFTVQNGVKCVRVCYVQESRIGDVIDVHVWAHSDVEARFCLESSSGQVFCQIAVEYFPTVAKL